MVMVLALVAMVLLVVMMGVDDGGGSDVCGVDGGFGGCCDVGTCLDVVGGGGGVEGGDGGREMVSGGPDCL